MKFVKLLPVVAAVAALSISTNVLAWDNYGSNPYSEKVTNNFDNDASVDLSKTDKMTALFNISSCIDVYGNIHVNQQAIAVTDAKQDLNGGWFDNYNQTNTATIFQSFQESSGIANVNVGAGSGFAQDNKVSIASLSNSNNSLASLDAETFLYQHIGPNITINDDHTKNTSSMGGPNSSDFDSYNGIANVNIGSGTSFEQANDVALAEGNGVVANSTAYDTQSISGLKETNNCGSNTSSIDQFAFDGAKGIQNVNIGSGSGFMQGNSVAISNASVNIH
jgi:hypothetical protein